MSIEFTKQAKREIQDFPDLLRADIADALARLDSGLSLSMPLSRPMPELGRGIHELRLKDRSGVYRLIYALVRHGRVLIVLGFKKTTQNTPTQIISTVRWRLKGYL